MNQADWAVAVAGALGWPAADLAGGVSAARAAARLGEQLAAEGPTTFGYREPDSRELAAGASIKASMQVLDPVEQELLAQLGIFGEDAAVPREVLVAWWDIAGACRRRVSIGYCWAW